MRNACKMQNVIPSSVQGRIRIGRRSKMLALRQLIKVLLGKASKLLDSGLVLLQVLYLIRYSLMALLIIAAFMPVTLYLLTTLLANLYDLDSFPKTFWFSLSAFLLAFSTITTLKLTLLYGGERVDFDRETRKTLDAATKRFAGSKLFFLAACTLTFIMIAGVFVLNFDFLCQKILGILVGFAAAMALLFLTDVLQRLLNRKSKAESLGGFLLPCKNPLENWANRCEYLHEITNKFFRPRFLEESIKCIPAFLGKGYIRYGADGKPETDDDKRAVVYPEHFTAIALFVFFFVVYLIIGWSPKELRDVLQVSALSYLMLLVTVLVWFLGAMSFFFDRYRLPVLLILIPVYMLASLTSEDYLFPVLNPNVEESRLLSSDPLTPAMVIDATPRSTELPGEEYAIVVAANGGGIQAAAWTARVLTGLEEKCKSGEFGPDFNGCASKIRLISSVSGGSVGAMYFLDAYEKGGIAPEKFKPIVDNAERTSLDSVAWGLVYPDFTRSFLPFFLSGYGRGHALEDRWAEGNDSLARGLLEWRDGVRSGWRPASIFNATIVETGERLLLSTSDLCEKKVPFGECLERAGQIKSVTVDPEGIKPQIDKKTFYGFIEGKDIPIKTAARLSASFPYVTPAPRADLNPVEMKNYHHVADGGYYDNYGISSLIEWLNEGLTNKTNKNLKHILIVQIRGDQVSSPTSREESSSRPYFQTLAPLKTMLSVRTTGQLSHNEAELEIFMRYWGLKDVHIETVVFEFLRDNPDDGPPLSWHLSQLQKDSIEKAWEKISSEADEDKAWSRFWSFIRARKMAGNATKKENDAVNK